MEFKVTGMSCGGCVNSVKRAVERVEPKAIADVDLASGRLRLELGAGAPADTVSRIVAAIEAAGFGAEVIGA